MPFEVLAKRQDTYDVWTLDLGPLDGKPLEFAPGQFTMLAAGGAGEVPISISGDPAHPDRLVHTVRAVGLATEAICGAEPGEVLSVRGPFGTGWPVANAEGSDVLIVAGGIGLPPLRPAILSLIAGRERYRRIVVLYGGRAPDQLLFTEEYDAWREQGVEVFVTVDSAGRLARARRRGHAPAAACQARGERARGHVVRPRGDDALRHRRPARRRDAPGAHVRVDGAQHAVRDWPLRPLPARAHAGLPRRRGIPLVGDRTMAFDQGAVMAAPTKLKLAVWKFSSCDGCQLSLLDCEDELLAIAGEIDIAYFLEATSAEVAGPYDLSIVEGSITNEHDIERILEVAQAPRSS